MPRLLRLKSEFDVNVHFSNISDDMNSHNSLRIWYRNVPPTDINILYDFKLQVYPLLDKKNQLCTLNE